MTIEERLAYLELQLDRVKRRNRLLAGTMLLLAGLLLLPMVFEISAFRAKAQVAGTANEIQANRFVLVDDRGIKRMILDFTDDSSRIALFNRFGVPRTLLTGNEEGGGLSISVDKGERSVSLGVNKDSRGLMVGDNKTGAFLGINEGSTTLSLQNDKGRVRAWLTTGSGVEGLCFVDKNGLARASLAMFQDGPVFMLMDEKNTVRAELTSRPSLTLRDEKSRGRFVAGKIQPEAQSGDKISDAESSLVLFGSDGKVIWSAIKKQGA